MSHFWFLAYFLIECYYCMSKWHIRQNFRFFTLQIWHFHSCLSNIAEKKRPSGNIFKNFLFIIYLIGKATVGKAEPSITHKTPKGRLGEENRQHEIQDMPLLPWLFRLCRRSATQGRKITPAGWFYKCFSVSLFLCLFRQGF